MIAQKGIVWRPRTSIAAVMMGWGEGRRGGPLVRYVTAKANNRTGCTRQDGMGRVDKSMCTNAVISFRSGAKRGPTLQSTKNCGGVEVGEENMALRDGAGGMDKWMDPTSPHNDEEVSARTG